jgi:hypothetical protein
MPINPDRTGQPSALGGGAAAPAQGRPTGPGLRAGAGVAFNRQLTDLRQGVPLRLAGAGTEPALGAGGVEVTVRKGDTLTSLVRDQWVARGGARDALTAHEAHRWALQVARQNGLSNPDLIVAGQSLVVGPPTTTREANVPRPIVRVDAPADGRSLGNPLLKQLGSGTSHSVTASRWVSASRPWPASTAFCRMTLRRPC